ncbi:MAG: hypothetical protein FWG22_06860, partial [Prolixibacteraceae bacterium]|nr:hypothetical protein [Prolixibacteraceae bacterium]
DHINLYKFTAFINNLKCEDHITVYEDYDWDDNLISVESKTKVEFQDYGMVEQYRINNGKWQIYDVYFEKYFVIDLSKSGKKEHLIHKRIYVEGETKPFWQDALLWTYKNLTILPFIFGTPQYKGDYLEFDVKCNCGQLAYVSPMLKLNSKFNPLTNHLHRNWERFVEFLPSETTSTTTAQSTTTTTTTANINTSSTSTTSATSTTTTTAGNSGGDENKNFLDSLLDGIKGLFIPSDDFFSNQFDDLKLGFEGKIPVISQVIEVAENISELIGNEGKIPEENEEENEETGSEETPDEWFDEE